MRRWSSIGETFWAVLGRIGIHFHGRHMMPYHIEHQDTRLPRGHEVERQMMGGSGNVVKMQVVGVRWRAVEAKGILEYRISVPL